MKEIILDLRSIGEDGDYWADSPARIELEEIMLDHSGKKIRVKITVVKEKQIW